MLNGKIGLFGDITRNEKNKNRIGGNLWKSMSMLLIYYEQIFLVEKNVENLVLCVINVKPKKETELLSK